MRVIDMTEKSERGAECETRGENKERIYLICESYVFVACRPSLIDVAGEGSVGKTGNSETEIKTSGYTAVLRAAGYDTFILG